MRDVDMTVVADDGVPLAGTLTLPPGSGPHPAVVLLHGSGPLDREGNTPKVRVGLATPLAEALAAEGIATLRYDRRGVGGTPGDWRAAGFVDNRLDGAAAVRSLAARPDIRADAVAVVGHSEGAVHAMALGARPDVSAVVLLAGYACRGEDAFRWQARSILGSLPAPVRLLRPAFRVFGRRQLRRFAAGTTDVSRVAGIPVNARWTREMLRHDTRTDLAALRVPVLALTGEKDLQIDPGHLETIRRLVPEPGGAEAHRIPDLTHVLRRDPGRPSMSAYRRLLREPVDPEVLTRVTDWLAARLDN
ncbi:alpha/beta hydrolase family protein [Streptomyces albiaxialis]|uniref:alpha/beta hydrolase family protein n=1 Tax=Streptomyces albiaxialis TaxID=329523 RepID=UPI0031D17FD2